MKSILAFWMIVLLGIAFIACDEDGGGTGDSDTDSDTDTDGDTDADADRDSQFPGNCDCAARFTLDGKTVDICENNNEYCRCRLLGSGETLSCSISSGQSSFKARNLTMSKLIAGERYTNFDNINSSVELTESGTNYLARLFSVTPARLEGSGGIATGTFTADITLSNGEEAEITDGQFYAPIVQE